MTWAMLGAVVGLTMMTTTSTTPPLQPGPPPVCTGRPQHLHLAGVSTPDIPGDIVLMKVRCSEQSISIFQLDLCTSSSSHQTASTFGNDDLSIEFLSPFSTCKLLYINDPASADPHLHQKQF